MSFLGSRTHTHLYVALLAATVVACQSKTDSGTASNATATAPPTAAAPQDSPGTWYRCYRGTLGADTITLHLQTWPTGFESRASATFVGSYSGPDGHPYELGTDNDTVAKPDSVVLRDRDLSFANENSSGPVWRLRLSGKELTGLRGSQRVQLREVTLPGSLTFASRYFTDSVAAYPNKPASPHGRTSLHVLLPTNAPETTRRPLNDGILRGLSGDSLYAKTTPTSAQQCWQQQLQAFQKEYKASVTELVPEMPTEPRYQLRCALLRLHAALRRPNCHPRPLEPRKSAEPGLLHVQLHRRRPRQLRYQSHHV